MSERMMAPRDERLAATVDFTSLPRDTIQQSIPQRFREQAARFPNRLAIIARDRSWTYAVLDAITDQIAAGLLERRGSLPEPIALLFDQGPDAVIAILGILKAGKFYTPLDPLQPTARLGGQIRSAEPGLIIAGQSQIALAQALSERHGMLVETVASLQCNVKIGGTCNAPRPDTLAYVFYTSGSTGNPKGVMDNHRNVLHNVVRYTNNLRVTPSDRLSLIQSPSFSGTVSSLFTALLNGAAICPFDVRREGFVALAAWVNDMGITVYHSVPAIFRGLVAGRQRFPSVRVVRLEGDQALPSDVELYRQHFAPECQLAIGLGATETGLSCQYVLQQTDVLASNIVPVGYPAEDMSISIVDEHGADIGLLSAGEIAVRSRYLAVGYWKQPELESEVFVPDPADETVRTYRTGDRGRLREDGCLEFLGRQHTRPRIHGQYVEIAEIETALQALEGILQAVVTVEEELPTPPRLVAFLVAEPTGRLTIAELRNRLSHKLPASMIPSCIVYLASLPLTANGKVDRHALPLAGDVPANTRRDHAPPRDACESALRAIWKEALGVAEIGINDNFFDLGGTSLVAARICAEVEQGLGYRLEADSLSLHPTIAEMADRLRGKESTHNLGPIVALQSGGSKPPLYFVHDHFGRISWYGPLARRLGSDQPCYGIKVAADSPPTEGPLSIEDMAAFYLDCIRSVQPVGSFHLAGLCFGGVVAFEMAQQSRARGEQIGLLALIGISPYDFPGAVSPLASYLWRGHAYLSAVPRKSADFRSLVIARAAAFGMCAKRRGRSDTRDDRSLARAATVSPGDPGSTVKSPELAAHHSRLFAKYRWRPYGGRLEIFLEADLARKYTPGPESWQSLSTVSVTTHLSPLRISEMFSEKHVGALAVELLRSLSNSGGPP